VPQDHGSLSRSNYLRNLFASKYKRGTKSLVSCTKLLTKAIFDRAPVQASSSVKRGSAASEYARVRETPVSS
jgi:hypothetical protein